MRTGPLQYKVVELSTVDEATLEASINEWARRGWNLDGIQFAMRDSSKRPAMAFVLFTKAGEAAQPSGEEARERLRRLAGEPSTPQAPAVSAYDRLAQLANEGDE
ncbi:MAG: hypothetical protein ACYC8T_07095 [Myxococcaceae bacterium]